MGKLGQGVSKLSRSGHLFGPQPGIMHLRSHSGGVILTVNQSPPFDVSKLEIWIQQMHTGKQSMKSATNWN